MSSMNKSDFKYLYGPVPSRRLGRSLGIDLVPFKTCSYDCIYCQLGRTTNKTLERKSYVATEDILHELEQKLAEKNQPDYISLAGSGEPTLNSNMGQLIERIKSITNIPVVVLTNGSLFWKSDVQDELLAADLVIPSLDAGDEAMFRYVNRPHKDISFEQMVDGLASFSKRFSGEIWLEVLLLAGVTGIAPETKKIAAICNNINVTRVQLNSVNRPPVESFAFPVKHEQLLSLKTLFQQQTDIISEPEPQIVQRSDTSPARDADILALLSRRPCTLEDVARGIGSHPMEALKHLSTLFKTGKLKTTLTGDRLYYSVSEISLETNGKDKNH